jgi:hypothetical protein
MNNSHRNAFKATAIFLAFALVQLSLQLSFAAPAASSMPTVPQELLGRITTTGTGPATINGNNAASGDTVTSGSIVQTPSGTEATVDLGPLGSIELQSGTRIRLDYSCPAAQLGNPDPQSCRVYVTLFAGCVTSNYKQGSHHKIAADSRGLIAQSDPDNERSGGGVLKTCSDSAPIAAVAPGGGGGAWTGTKIGLLLAAIAVPTAVILIALDDENPSPSAP